MGVRYAAESLYCVSNGPKNENLNTSAREQKFIKYRKDSHLNARRGAVRIWQQLLWIHIEGYSMLVNVGYWFEIVCALSTLSAT